MKRTTCTLALVCAALGLPGVVWPVSADEPDDLLDLSLQELEVLVVTAARKGPAENVQDVPISMASLGAAQLEALHFKDLADISLRVTNANIQPVGTIRGVSAFAIRGLSPTSSVPSIDPTVGTFIDGLYLPSNAGVVFDSFDVESVEVLRGPQGVLFGRNVVGGAVLVNTRPPADVFTADLMVRAESGLRGTGENLTVSGVVSGPIARGLRGKLAAYVNDDAGWFENERTGSDFDANEISLVRGAISWDMGERADVLLSYEHGDQDGDGQPNQSHDNLSTGNPGLFRRGSHDMTTDLDSFQEADWDQLVLTATVDVPFGAGRITNILGWRDFEQAWLLDLDATDNFAFHGAGAGTLEHVSNELRYFGTFGPASVTSGLYYLDSNLTYQESRFLDNGNVSQNGFGVQEAETYGVFGNVDYRTTPALVLSAGLRYTYEKKSVESGALAGNPAPCGPAGPVSCVTDFVDSDSWENLSYRLGATYHLSDTTMVYTHVSRSYRAGGYNVRRSNVEDDRESYDDERVDQLEVGLKSDVSDRLRLNAAAFFMKAKDLQRLILVDTPLGPAQNTANTADADIIGMELDGILQATERLSLRVGLGFLHAEYTKVIHDLNNDGVVDAADKALDLPSVPDFTASLSLRHDLELGSFGSLTTELAYGHRASLTNTANTNLRNARDEVDLNLVLAPRNGRWSLSLYGRNLTNDVNYLEDVSLDFDFDPLPSTLSTMEKGRRLGVEFRYRFGGGH